MADDNTTPNSEQSAEQSASAPQDQQPTQEQAAEQVASAPQAQQAPSAAQAQQQPAQEQSAAQAASAAQSQQSSQGFVPPAGQVPPQQPNPSFAQAAPTPQNLPGMPLLYLTSGMKFGWAVVGFFVGPIGILIAWLTNAHNFPQAKSEAVKFSLIGFLASIVVVLLLLIMVGFAACSAFNSMTSSYYPYYY